MYCLAFAGDLIVITFLQLRGEKSDKQDIKASLRRAAFPAKFKFELESNLFGSERAGYCIYADESTHFLVRNHLVFI